MTECEKEEELEEFLEWIRNELCPHVLDDGSIVRGGHRNVIYPIYATSACGEAGGAGNTALSWRIK